MKSSKIEIDRRYRDYYNNGKLFDCHNHTWRSHDSRCDPEMLCRCAVRKGLSGIAFTDHCDMEYVNQMDVASPIRGSADDSRRCQEIHAGRLKVLTGIEMGEAIWYFWESEEIVQMLPYDIVLGSVHAVRSRLGREPYSQIDFSGFTRDEIDAYMRAYFDDMSEMIEKCDFNVLSHLTCPLRYITGKYGIPVDMEKYEAQVNQILRQIIEKRIALEINTSNKGSRYDAFMPTRRIIEQYRAMGGYLITVGSDAHVAENTGYMLGQACEMLKEIGFPALYYYENRKPVPCRLLREEKGVRVSG